MRDDGCDCVKICLLGLGYIGLPTALLFAANGHSVAGVDTNPSVIDTLERGEVPFKEPLLDDLFSKARDNGNFHATTSPEQADVFIIAVPTPLDKEMRIADLTYVRKAAVMVAEHMKKGALIVLESTVPPGTSEKVIVPVLRQAGFEVSRDYLLVHCPERAIPGNTIHEMIQNDRIIGGIDENSGLAAKKLYQSFVKGTIYVTDIRTAELIKLMENTYRDINIAMANEFALLAEDYRVNIWDAIALANKHPRVKILMPGPGVGGHCLAVDPWFLTENSSHSRIVSLAREINDSMPNHVVSMIKEVTAGIDSPTVCILGVAYKANVSDTRESPAIRIIRLAINEGWNLLIHDPHVCQFMYPLVSLQDATRECDCIVVVTDHEEFRQIDPRNIASLVRTRNVIDTRNILLPEAWKAAGFSFRKLGDYWEG